jgi:hypothetical protein
VSSQAALANPESSRPQCRQPQLNNPEPALKRCRCAAQHISRPTIRAGF